MQKHSRTFSINTKILITIAGLWLIGSSALVAMSYWQTRNALRDTIRTRVRDYAALGVLNVPAEEHAKIKQREDENTDTYASLVAILRRIKANCTDIIYAYTVRKNEDGQVIFVTDATEAEDDMSHPGDVMEVVTPLLAKALDGLEAPIMEEDFYTDQWGTFLSAYAPIRTQDGIMDGLLCLDITFASVQRILMSQLWRLILILALSSLLIIPIAYFLSRSLSRPISVIIALLKRISNGGITDLTKRFEVVSNDEIGDMAVSLNETFDKVRNLIAAIKKQADALSNVGVELSSNMTETASSIQEISANIQSVQKQTNTQSASVIETNSAMEEITKSIRRLNEHIDTQSTSVTQSSSAIEEMLASIASVTSTLAKNSETVKNLSVSSEEGRSNLAAVSANIRDVAKESEGLLEISAVIENVASQTNLLSMNAAIEAAHAGDSGKGFAVVAGEIRKLAESSSRQSKTVSSSLKKIKDAMNTVTKATDKVLSQFEAINLQIKSMSEREQAIWNAMDEQGAGSKEILAAIGQLIEITSEVKSGSDMIRSGSEDVIRESAVLGRITEEVTGSMDQMAVGTEQITTAVNQVNDISRNNKESIDALLEEVEKFKIE